MTLNEINKLWPESRITFVCEYATEKLRNLMGINFIFMDQFGWKLWEPTDDEFYITVTFLNAKTNQDLTIDFHQDLFIKDYLDFDNKTGVIKIKDIRDKVILRIAWHLKERWEGKD